MIKSRLIAILFSFQVAFVLGHWNDEGPVGNGHGKLAALDVICGKDHMTVRAEFAGPFHGIVASKGTYGQDNCVYIKPYSGVTHATFKVYYDQCGTKPDLQGKYYENTVVIQYGTDIIEAWDEAKRLRCEWFEAYEKPATFRPAIPVADLDVVEMNFQGDDIDCWMEIQEGKGPFGREVSRIVPVGQPMTIVIAINDYGGEFDMRVKSCFAHDGIKPAIHLTDEHGCVLRPKMLTKFEKAKDPNGKATVISYAYFYAFKFPDSMNVQIQCTVEVCRHGCPDACQKTPYHHKPDRQFKQQISLSYDQRSSQSTIQASSKPQPGSHYQPHHHQQQPPQHQQHHQGQPSITMKEQTETQDLQRLASSDVPSPPTVFHQSTISSEPSSTPSSEPVPAPSFPSNRFDSKRLPVYNEESAPGNGLTNDTATNNENSGDANEHNGENGPSGDEDEAASEGEETKVSKESDYQSEPSNDKKLMVPQTPHHPPPSVPSPSESSSSSVPAAASQPEGDQEKPVFVPGDNNNNPHLDHNNQPANVNDETKESLFSRFANNNYDKAAELFKDLGVNMDIAKFASGFISGIEGNSANQANLAAILENDKIRDMVEASGVNLKESNHLAPQPLISKPMRDLTDTNEEEHLNPEELSALAASEHMTSPVPTSSYPYSLMNPSAETGQQQQQQQQQPHPQHQHRQPPPPPHHHLHGHPGHHPQSASPQSASGTQVNQVDQGKGQLSGINNENNIIPNQQSLSSISSLAVPNSVPIRVNENDNARRPDKEETKHDSNTVNLNLESSALPSKGINLAHNSNLHPEALTALNLENPVAQVVPLPLGIGPINNFGAPKFNHLMPPHQPQGPQQHPLHPPHPLIHHHHQQKLQHHQQQQQHQQQPPHPPHHQQHQQRIPLLPQRPVIIHDGVQLRPQLGLKQQRPPQGPPSNLPLHRAASLLANFAGLSNLNIPFLSSMQRQDQRNLVPQPQPVPNGPVSQAFPHGPRSFRSKRSSSSKPIVSVKKGFQVVTSIDLDFNPNSTDLPEIHQGHREQIIYGVCLPTNGFIVSLVTIISIVILSLVSSFILIRRLNRSRSHGKALDS